MSTYPKHSLSPEDYLVQERRATFKSEYAAGEVLAMAGANRVHDALVKNLSDFFTQRRLRACGCTAFTSDMKVYLRDDSVYCYPDLSVCCGPPEFMDATNDVLLNPTAVFEVLSPSTKDYDLGDKSFYYRRNSSLRHILLVWSDIVRVGHWTRSQGEQRWTFQQYQDMETPITLPEMGMSLPIAEIYIGAGLV